MNWKQFLKLDKRKVGLTIFIIIICLFLFYFFCVGYKGLPYWLECCGLIQEGQMATFCEKVPENYCCTTNFTEEECIRLKTERQVRNTIDRLMCNAIFIIFILSYPISCSIVWIYNKFRK